MAAPPSRIFTAKSLAVTTISGSNKNDDEIPEELWAKFLSFAAGQPPIDMICGTSEYIIGSGKSKAPNQVQIADGHISKQHCRVYNGNDGNPGVYIKDCNSTNGIYINTLDRPNTSNVMHRLKHGDVVCLGRPQTNGLLLEGRPESTEVNRFRVIIYSESPLIRKEDPQERPTRFDDVFTQGDALGDGAQGTVFKAVPLHPKPEDTQEYAVKFIDTNGADGDISLKQYTRELTTLQMVKHNNIIRYVACYNQRRGLFAIVTEYVPYHLRKYCQDRFSGLTIGLLEPSVKGCCVQLLDGMNYMHALNIIHRDIKLENILCTKAGELKIADFGFAREVDPNQFTKQTRLGTPLYIAPEMVRPGKYDFRVDSYSLGIVIMALLFKGKTDLIYIPPRASPTQTDEDWIDKRVINWENFKSLGVSAGCASFVYSMTTFETSRRLTMKEAREHVWITGISTTTVIPEFTPGTRTRRNSVT